MADGFDVTTRSMLRSNEANWDARTPVHLTSAFYGLDGTRTPFDWFAPFEWEDLGDLAGREVLHLQCHLGTETLAFAYKDAKRTVGLDFSSESLEHARRMASEAGVDVEYVYADVYDATEALDGHRFDVIYTGKGSLCYLPDLARWARIITELLRPGGILYVTEFHPLLNSLGPVSKPGEGEELLLRNDYLPSRGAVEREATYTYTDGPALQGTRVSYEWMHGLGDVVNAVVGAGMTVSGLRESDMLPWRRWKQMVHADNGWWRLPDGAPRIPLLYALRATP
ncbi:class I SAM-dependent methyltransferase [Haloactinomyces albus]|uniref:SAM-dependent methyltransferase n=1 Tax=Haloactinomyces albus TaxID=1352928 RepID=A0AAE3ZFK0_9ACTN|nr:class I SAM-dependent methyltransferase [Haloactinomyces albus]MDR7303000.1 SAM-dependent methyltransferase [Haloactinomyces albus]